MPDMWPQLPRDWESYHLVLELDEVLEYSKRSRPGSPTDISEGVAFILNYEVSLYRASMEYEISCTFNGKSYCLSAGFAGGVEAGQFTYPRVHLVPSTMKIVQAEGGLCLLLSLLGHIDQLPHLTDRSAGGWKRSDRALSSLHYWSRCRYLGLELPPVRSVAELLGFDPPAPNGSN